MSDREVKLIDTTVRDGHQSLWALRMGLDCMAPAIEDIARAGFDGVEFLSRGGQLSKFVRDGVDPWHWLQIGRDAAPKGLLRLHGSINQVFGNGVVPMSVQKRFLDFIEDFGLTVCRGSDPWNDYSRMRESVKLQEEYGIETVVNLIFSVSPRHTDEYYRERTRQALELAPYRLCLKDVSGLLTPERARRLVPIILEEAGDTPVELHIHCNNGLGAYVALVSVECGIRYVHTAIPPLAEGTSQPSVFDIHRNLTAKGYEVDVDLGRCERVSRHLELYRRVNDLPAGSPRPFDELAFGHQIPGGMVSNLKFQLEQVGQADRFADVAVETTRVREDFGYPIMVTPLAQFVGTQAFLNVTSDRRYERVTDEVIGYALGQWGDEAVEVIDPEVREQILGRRRADEVRELLAAGESDDVSFEEVRRQFPAAMSEHEIVARIIAGVGQKPIDYGSLEDVPRTYEEYEARNAGPVGVLTRMLTSKDVKRFHFSDADMTIDVVR